MALPNITICCKRRFNRFRSLRGGRTAVSVSCALTSAFGTLISVVQSLTLAIGLVTKTPAFVLANAEA